MFAGSLLLFLKYKYYNYNNMFCACKIGKKKGNCWLLPSVFCCWSKAKIHNAIPYSLCKGTLKKQVISTFCNFYKTHSGSQHYSPTLTSFPWLIVYFL